MVGSDEVHAVAAELVMHVAVKPSTVASLTAQLLSEWTEDELRRRSIHQANR
jgi:hypothetical protein